METCECCNTAKAWKWESNKTPHEHACVALLKRCAAAFAFDFTIEGARRSTKSYSAFWSHCFNSRKAKIHCVAFAGIASVCCMQLSP
jgi:hypothetical protein